MRFSHFLKYNAVPEWQNHYMDYIALKNLIYTLQTDELKENDARPTSLTKEECNDKNDDIHETTHFSSEDLENNTGSSSTDLFNRNFARKFKNTFFKKKTKSKHSTSFNEHVEDPENEQTFELGDLSTKNENKDKVKSGSSNKLKDTLRKPKGRLFSSRASSISSDGKTLYGSYDSFVSSLTDEKIKVDDFYKRTEAKFYERLDNLIHDLEKEGVTHINERFFPSEELSSEEQNQIKPLDITNTTNIESFELRSQRPSTELRSRYDYSEDGDEDDEDEEVDDFEATHDNTALLNYSQFNIKSQKKSLLKQSIINLFVDLSQLKSFIELNKMGFSKITKKADKVLHLNTRAELIENESFFKDTYIFLPETFNILNTKISELIEFYAIIKGRPAEIESCKQDLKSFLHDHIVWERSNTWKDMLGLLSQSKDIQTDVSEKELEEQKRQIKLNLPFKAWKLPKPITIRNIEIEQLKLPALFFTWKAFKLAFIITLTGVLLGIKTFNDPVEGRCMALVECVAFLWASEAIPLHVTALLVPLLSVLFRVFKNSDGTTMGAVDTSTTVLSAMWSSTIMILLAGFTLGAALSEYEIAEVLASWLLAFAGTKPRNILLMAMSVVFFLSMWISNVASPVLTYSLLTPLLETSDATSPFARALIMGVALSADLGGLASPISSPQNIISMEYLKPYGIGWGQFFAVALPTGVLAMLLAWGLVCVTFKMHKTKVEKFTPIRTKFTIKQYYVIFVTLGTIILWCVEAQIEGAFGSSGQIAVLPMVLFFGTGLLTTADLNAFPWSIVILAMGGIALGKGVSSSGLLVTVGRALQRKIESDGIMAILCIFGILMLVVGTFVSHTVSAIIIIPIVQEVGDNLSDPKGAPILVFGCALLASAGICLPSSGFPNQIAISMLDKKVIDI
ncbi:SPX domain-containing inorganic phosphate transporter NDAI_0A00700 [Naumovozyma dairenensis CBS 421]|uniref:SPX domain-containing protein n=1 Tax=Naumovozyma dairenensis (strain ATCC 10597 / BCRC 20456 / CBS 421 / NBRC 0211 / NRRL Y-12639) TaxID=1071378 RepID=G0W340_NAUDC|nr:hypothetical protein NDAI_0A00700 [Naumovozyma dairenensis CBS 421]CCD22228.1 hypothetical protein NDAI_0A00700 [Naumovozyma dairenensis CBS 421]